MRREVVAALVGAASGFAAEALAGRFSGSRAEDARRRSVPWPEDGEAFSLVRPRGEHALVVAGGRGKTGPPSGAVECPECGLENAAGERECVLCGEPLAPAASPGGSAG